MSDHRTTGGEPPFSPGDVAGAKALMLAIIPASAVAKVRRLREAGHTEDEVRSLATEFMTSFKQPFGLYGMEMEYARETVAAASQRALADALAEPPRQPLTERLRRSAKWGDGLRRELTNGEEWSFGIPEVGEPCGWEFIRELDALRDAKGETADAMFFMGHTEVRPRDWTNGVPCYWYGGRVRVTTANPPDLGSLDRKPCAIGGRPRRSQGRFAEPV
jgi:hypothetical protein